MKKGGRGGHDDNDSVDSHGNIRGLIDYDYDSEVSEDKPVTKKNKKSPPSDAKKTNSKRRYELNTNDDKAPNFKKYGKSHVSASASASASASSSLHSNTVVQPKEKNNVKTKVQEKLRTPLKNKKSKYIEEETEDEDDDDFIDEDEDEEEEFDEDDEDADEDADEDEDTDEDAEDDDFEEDDDEDEDEDEDGDDDDEAEGGKKKRNSNSANILFTFGTDDMMRNIPQRHNMKKETPAVKKFVKLLTEPMEDNTIDAQIDQFKALTQDKQKELLLALYRDWETDRKSTRLNSSH